MSKMIGTAIGFLILFGYPLYYVLTNFSLVEIIVMCLLGAILVQLKELRKERKPE